MFHQMAQIQEMYTNGVDRNNKAEYERRVQFAQTDRNYVRLTYDVLFTRLRARTATYVLWKDMDDEKKRAFESRAPRMDTWNNSAIRAIAEGHRDMPPEPTAELFQDLDVYATYDLNLMQQARLVDDVGSSIASGATVASAVPQTTLSQPRSLGVEVEVVMAKAGVQSASIPRAQVAVLARQEAQRILRGGEVGHVTDIARETLQDQYEPAVDVMDRSLDVDLSRLDRQQPVKRVRSSAAGFRDLGSTVAGSTASGTQAAQVESSTASGAQDESSQPGGQGPADNVGGLSSDAAAGSATTDDVSMEPEQSSASVPQIPANEQTPSAPRPMPNVDYAMAATGARRPQRATRVSASAMAAAPPHDDSSPDSWGDWNAQNDERAWG